jgi:hypothetical protein
MGEVPSCHAGGTFRDGWGLGAAFGVASGIGGRLLALAVPSRFFNQRPVIL